MPRKKRKHPGGRPLKYLTGTAAVTIRFEFALYRCLELAAKNRHKNVPALLRKLVEDFLEEFSLSETPLLIAKTQHAVLMIKELIATAKVMKFPRQSEKGGAGGLAQEERQRRREKLSSLGMDSFAEVYKIAMSEKAAEESQYRIQAYMVLSRLGAFNAAVLRDATREEMIEHMVQLEEENERLDAMGREIQAQAVQEAQAVQQPASPAKKPN